MTQRRSLHGRWILPVIAGLALGACQTAVRPHGSMGMNHERFANGGAPEFKPGEVYEAPRVLDLSAILEIKQLMPKLLQNRVIYVGETHDRLDHHLNQLEVIRRAYEDNPALAIGMEFFQQPFQPALDDYIAGKIDEKEFLKKSEYYLRWRIDYRHYRPIIRYAREKGIPLVALDIAEELRKKVARNELDKLSEAETVQLAREVDRSNKDYRDMLSAIFAMHPDSSDFERFVETQLARDEAMAQRAVEYLQKHPASRMVVLAGGGHLVYGYGIPSRIKRRLDVPSAIILNDSLRDYDANVADYLLMPNPLRLPKEARLGVVLDTSRIGQLNISSFADGSPAIPAGLEKGDRLLSIDGQLVNQMADLKIALLDRIPGDKVQVKVQRTGWFGGQKELGFEVALY